MKHAGGFHVDITGANMPDRDMTIIRMNGDDLDGACQLLASHGFRAVEGSASVAPSSKSVLMASPTGLAIDVVMHIGAEDG